LIILAIALTVVAIRWGPVANRPCDQSAAALIAPTTTGADRFEADADAMGLDPLLVEENGSKVY
jgi:hypothetical protein